MTANKNIKTPDQFKEEHYGKIGTAKRDKLDKGFKSFKLGALIHEARRGIKSYELRYKSYEL